MTMGEGIMHSGEDTLNIEGAAIGRRSAETAGGRERPQEPGLANTGVQNLGPGQIVMSGNAVGPGATVVNGEPRPFTSASRDGTYSRPGGRQPERELEAG